MYLPHACHVAYLGYQCSLQPLRSELYSKQQLPRGKILTGLLKYWPYTGHLVFPNLYDKV